MKIDHELIGYRSWLITKDNLLSSVVSKKIWVPGEPMTGDIHSKVGATCNIPGGIYCTKEPNRDSNYLDGIYGSVSIWGKIQPHQSGYRASLAYPRCLWYIPTSTGCNHDSYSGISRDAFLEIVNKYGCEFKELDPIDTPCGICSWDKLIEDAKEIYNIMQHLQSDHSITNLHTPGIYVLDFDPDSWNDDDTCDRLPHIARWIRCLTQDCNIIDVTNNIFGKKSLPLHYSYQEIMDGYEKALHPISLDEAKHVALTCYRNLVRLGMICKVIT